MSSSEYSVMSNITTKVDESYISWNRDDYVKLLETYGIPAEWGPEYPADGSVASQPPSGKMALYADYFLHANFRLPITKFLGKIIRNYQIHISQLHPRSMARIRHFEFICTVHNLQPRIDWFPVFYQLALSKSWYKCQGFIGRRLGKEAEEIPKHWRKRFFWISEDVIPLNMARRPVDSPLPVVTAALDPESQSWFLTLLSQPAPMRALPEEALVWAGMSRLWSEDHLEPIFVDNHGCKISIL